MRRLGEAAIGVAVFLVSPVFVAIGLALQRRLPSGKAGPLTLAAPLAFALWCALAYAAWTDGLGGVLFVLAVIGLPILAGIGVMLAILGGSLLWLRIARWLRAR